MQLVGRTGHFSGDVSSQLLTMLAPGWNAAVTLVKCDTASTEETAYVLQHQPGGRWLLLGCGAYAAHNCACLVILKSILQCMLDDCLWTQSGDNHM